MPLNAICCVTLNGDCCPGDAHLDHGLPLLVFGLRLLIDGGLAIKTKDTMSALARSLVVRPEVLRSGRSGAGRLAFRQKYMAECGPVKHRTVLHH